MPKLFFIQQLRYFTWYPKQASPMNDTDCFLVGFNLRQACFNLAEVCALMKECETFNTTCTKCQVWLKVEPVKGKTFRR